MKLRYHRFGEIHLFCISYSSLSVVLKGAGFGRDLVGSQSPKLFRSFANLTANFPINWLFKFPKLYI